MKIDPIATFESCYPEKFGVPRQPGLVPDANGRVVLLPPYDVGDALRGLDRFSHLWLVFGFHECANTSDNWRPTVRPPRLGGNERVGVFASRSPFRPNGLGLSVVRIVAVHAGKSSIDVTGHDLVDSTPIYDLKPYIPYSDAVANATCGFASPPKSPLANLPIQYSIIATRQLTGWTRQHSEFRQLLENTLHQDPRPAYQDDPSRIYGLRLHDANIRWQVKEDAITILEITPHTTREDPRVAGPPSGA